MERVNISAAQTVIEDISRMARYGKIYRRSKRFAQPRIRGTARRNLHRRQRSRIAHEQHLRSDMENLAMRSSDEGVSAADSAQDLRRSVRPSNVPVITQGDGTFQRRIELGLCPRCATAFDGTHCRTCQLTISRTVLQK